MLFLINDGWLIGCILGLPFLLCGILCLTCEAPGGAVVRLGVVLGCHAVSLPGYRDSVDTDLPDHWL